MSTVRIFVQRKAQAKQYVRYSEKAGFDYTTDVSLASVLSLSHSKRLYNGTVDDFMRTGKFRHARGMECVNEGIDHLIIGVETNLAKPEPVTHLVLIPKEG